MTSQGSSWPDYKFIAESLCYKLKALNLKDVFIHPNENTLLSCIMGIVGPSVFGAKTQVAQPVVFFFFFLMCPLQVSQHIIAMQY